MATEPPSTPAQCPPSPFGMAPAAQAATEYFIDAWQRSILTWDVLRERGNQYLEHMRSGKPPVLAFDYEMVMDGRTLPKPANYALVRVKPSAGHPPTDAAKRPFVVIDPRAGHGPGIGGFKMDSAIGIALQSGQPCYFVMFFPHPEPEQTIESVCAAEIAFLRKVRELHPDAEGAPFVIGNCQGGWALLMVAALAPDLVGPILLAGAPVSYWAGGEGLNPMRYSGGLLGGSWMASLFADLGNGKFDGVHLVSNFESLNPANTYWSKLYNLYSKVDTERARFLEFEKWWGGYFLMNRAEIDWIVQNLFVGNRLSAGEVQSFDGAHRVDLRRIRTPIIVFASWGDNITPPQQALNWIPDLYRSVEEIHANEQTIVYCLHDNVGHLGIFVSTSVAKRETAELHGALELIDTLPHGLYEALIEDTCPDMPGLEYVEGRYLIKFVPRTIEDILTLGGGREDEHAFEVVDRVSRVNQRAYDTFASPVVKALSSESSARAMRDFHPARVERWAFSDLNPWMAWVRWMADTVRENRQQVSPDNPLLAAEREMSDRIVQALDQVRDARDDASERMFEALYASPQAAAAVGLAPGELGRRGPPAPDSEQAERARLKLEQVATHVDSGSLLDGWMRLMLYVRRVEHVDERPFNMVRRMLAEAEHDGGPSLAALKAAVKRQAAVLALDEARAIEALPTLLPEMRQRREAFDTARRVVQTRGDPTPDQEERFRRLGVVLGLDDSVRTLKSA